MKSGWQILLLFYLFLYCNNPVNRNGSGSGLNEHPYTKGTFGYDVQFLSTYYDDLVILSDRDAQLVVSPGFQGRVMTSTAGGMDGTSFGWLNYDLIATRKKQEHFNPVGGEERFWLGPEGGQFSIYFKPGTEFIFENWFVPKEIDTEPFILKRNRQREAHFEKEFQLINYRGSEFKIKIDRKIRLLEKSEIEAGLNVLISDNVRMVGYESENILTNIGPKEWDRETGMLSIWILNMFKPSSATTVIVPFRAGDNAELGKIVTDDYFGEVPSTRILVSDSVIFFKADGKLRSKIGINPKRALPVAGSFDSESDILTIVQYSLDREAAYVNSLWEQQDEPFNGDAFNAYNDGPLETGEQLGPFYELESSSPAAGLKPVESHTHLHRTIHFQGPTNELDIIMKHVLGVGVETIGAQAQ